jgi:hypothetical protein
LIFGGVGSLLVALVYVPGWSALQNFRRGLADDLSPIITLEDGAAILAAAMNRKDLEGVVGLDNSILADLQSGLATLAPLLAGIASAFLLR